MFLRMLWQSIRQNKKRSFLLIITVCLASSLGMALSILSIGVGDKMSLEMRSYGSNLTIRPKADTLGADIGRLGKNPLKGKDALKESDLLLIKDIFWRNNIIGISPLLHTKITTVGYKTPISLIGTYFKKVIVLPDGERFMTGVRSVHKHWEVQGKWPNMAHPSQVLIGELLAKQLQIGISQDLTISSPQNHSYPVHVVGIVSTGGDEDKAIISSLSLAQKIANAPERVDEFQISALTVPENGLSRKARSDVEKLTSTEYDTWYCTAYVSSIAHQIEEALPKASAQPVWKVAAGEGAVIGKMQVLLFVVTIAAFVSAAMGVSSLMTTTVSERAKEIGLMKALGADISSILNSFVAEAAILSATGGTCGACLGAVLSQAISRMVFGTGMDIPWIVIPLTIILAILIGLAGSIVPAKRIARVAPVEVLYGKR